MLYEVPRVGHHDAVSVEDAVDCLAVHGEKAAVIAGATDLLGLLKDRVRGPALPLPELLVNIKKIPCLNQIARDGELIRIGAAVTLTDLADSALIQAEFPLLAQAAGQVGTTQLRNRGTLGGNLCQRPRCMYFRHPDFVCFKKGGVRCFAAAGEHRDYHAILKPGRCLMAHPSDLAPALVALKAVALVAGPGGRRSVPLADFFRGPDQLRETVLDPGEFLLEVLAPRPASGARQVFLKHRVRQSVDFALASLAALAIMRGGVCEEIGLVLGGVSSRPIVAEAAEKLLQGKRLDDELIEMAARTALEGARPLRNNGWKVDLAGALVRRALRFVAEEPT